MQNKRPSWHSWGGPVRQTCSTSSGTLLQSLAGPRLARGVRTLPTASVGQGLHVCHADLSARGGTMRTTRSWPHGQHILAGIGVWGALCARLPRTMSLAGKNGPSYSTSLATMGQTMVGLSAGVTLFGQDLPSVVRRCIRLCPLPSSTTRPACSIGWPWTCS